MTATMTRPDLWTDAYADENDYENRMAMLDERAAWYAAGCPEPDETLIPEDVKAMVPAPAVVSIAFRGQRELAGLLHRDFTADTRTHVMGEYRRSLADALAESRTGVARCEADLTNRYSRSQLSDRQIERATNFRAAYAVALAELPSDYEDLLVWCEIACGVRRQQLVRAA